MLGTLGRISPLFGVKHGIKFTKRNKKLAHKNNDLDFLPWVYRSGRLTPSDPNCALIQRKPTVHLPGILDKIGVQGSEKL